MRAVAYTADRREVGCRHRTLFLYAKTKGELLLVLLGRYAEALEKGMAEAEATPDVLDAVMVVLRAIVDDISAQVATLIGR